ncbi:cytochrome C1 family-domain-containing protein [Mycena galericulata]|nr:cytochrome C1 family-domain-containing protein [Mycena galericulata]
MLSRQLSAGALRKAASSPAFRLKSPLAFAVRNASTASSSSARLKLSISVVSQLRMTLASVVSLHCWFGSMYTHLYGSLPFLPQGLHPPEYPWPHKGLLDTIRRGCAACHSLDRIAWRNLVARTMAEEVEYQDGPDDQERCSNRPGKLSDYMPPPYANEEAARAGKRGRFASRFESHRQGAPRWCLYDYIFALLTGYVDPPAGVEVREGMNYNPFFPGGAIGMARVLFDGLVEYEDGTPATTSQMAKDVVTFLNWAAEPEHDERKKTGIKAVILFSTMMLISLYVKRFKWTPIKNRNSVLYDPPVDKTH